DAINERLASPPESDLADSDQLGLFVAGRLAARHGIKVTLRTSYYGGITARVGGPPESILPEGGGHPWVGPGGARAPPAVATHEGMGQAGPGGNGQRGPVFGITGRHRLASQALMPRDSTADGPAEGLAPAEVTAAEPVRPVNGVAAGTY